MSVSVPVPSAGAIRHGLRGMGHVWLAVARLAADLAALERQGGAASVDRVTAIVDATSNVLLTRLGAPGATLAGAFEEAQRLGCAEPDPTPNVDGCDAADKLSLLASLFGWGPVSDDDLEIEGIGAVTAADIAAARRLDAEIKPIVWAVRNGSSLEAFVGPTLISRREPLAATDGALNGIRLDGKYLSNLFFCGPGAGPDVRIAMRLDDRNEARRVSAPRTRWFVRLTFPGVVPSEAALRSLVASSGFEIEEIVDVNDESTRWITIGLQSRTDVTSACGYLRAIHRIDSVLFRRLD